MADEFSRRDFEEMRQRDGVDDTHMTAEQRAELWELSRKRWENSRWWEAQPSWPPWPFRRAKPPHPDAPNR
jgi:hypothetical protein